jgi:uncharacterized protein
MYIEQLFKKTHDTISIALYFIIPLFFLALMVFNFNQTDERTLSTTIDFLKSKVGLNGLFVILVGPLAFFLLLILFYNKFVQNKSIRILTTSRPAIDWKRIFFSFGIWTFFMLLITLSDYFMHPENYQLNFQADKFFVFMFLAILLLPLQTSFEEYLFRGQFLQGLGLATKTRYIPLILTSVFFGIAHIANPEVDKLGNIMLVYYIGTGFFLGIITLMDEGLELALGFHAANNLVSALLVTNHWGTLQTHSVFKNIEEPSVGFDIFIPVFIIYPILIYVFSKKYQWNNWKERLFGDIKPLNIT